MELEFERDTIACWETVADTTLCQEETLESIVPDACPDILRIIDVCGQAVLTGKQAREGAAVVNGAVRAVILYQPEDGTGLRRMEVSLPFTCQAEASGLTAQGFVAASPRLRCAEARMLNPRKVLLRVDLAVDVTACQPKERTVCCAVANPEANGICQRQYQGEDYQLSSVQEKPFTFSERIRFQSGAAEGAQVLAAWAQPLCTESRLIGSKLIFKGTVELQLLIQEPGGGQTASQESLPFSQVLEMEGSGEDTDCQVSAVVTEFQWHPWEEDPRELEVTLELLAQAQVHSRRPVRLLQDLYSTGWRMDVDRELQELCRLEDASVRTQSVRELLETGEAVRSVVESRLSLGQVRQSREGDELVLAADAFVTVLYLDENEQVQCVKKSLTAACRVNCSEAAKCTCRCSAPGEVFAAPAAGGVEVRFQTEFHCMLTVKSVVPCVCSAQFGEARGSGETARPSVVLRLAGPGEGLWDIAKSYGTTIEQIVQANELESEETPLGKMLLIPRVR